MKDVNQFLEFLKEQENVDKYRIELIQSFINELIPSARLWGGGLSDMTFSHELKNNELLVRLSGKPKPIYLSDKGEFLELPYANSSILRDPDLPDKMSGYKFHIGLPSNQPNLYQTHSTEELRSVTIEEITEIFKSLKKPILIGVTMRPSYWSYIQVAYKDEIKKEQNKAGFGDVRPDYIYGVPLYILNRQKHNCKFWYDYQKEEMEKWIKEYE